MLLLATRSIQSQPRHPLRQLLLLHTSVARRRYSGAAPVAPKSPTPDPSERYHNTVQLPDGRTLAWAEAGSPSGFPLFFLHGFPGSRMEARGLEDIGRRHDLRFICPERPGYGMSTFQPGRRLLDWPADVRFLAREHLDVKRYSVLGGSGGGPHACMYIYLPTSC